MLRRRACSIDLHCLVCVLQNQTPHITLHRYYYHYRYSHCYGYFSQFWLLPNASTRFLLDSFSLFWWMGVWIFHPGSSKCVLLSVQSHTFRTRKPYPFSFCPSLVLVLVLARARARVRVLARVRVWVRMLLEKTFRPREQVCLFLFARSR